MDISYYQTPAKYIDTNGEVHSRKICPACGDNIDGMGALSRKDNETEICDRCGTKEAMHEYYVDIGLKNLS